MKKRANGNQTIRKQEPPLNCLCQSRWYQWWTGESNETERKHERIKEKVKNIKKWIAKENRIKVIITLCKQQRSQWPWSTCWVAFNSEIAQKMSQSYSQGLNFDLNTLISSACWAEHLNYTQGGCYQTCLFVLKFSKGFTDLSPSCVIAQFSIQYFRETLSNFQPYLLS